MRPIAFFVPGPLDARTGGTIYDRRMAEALRARGHRVDLVELRPSFPNPTVAALDHARYALKQIRTGTIAVVDSLALGAMPDLLEGDRDRLWIVALMHLPLTATAGHNPAWFEAGERRALRMVKIVIVTGKAALPLLARYDLRPDRIVIVEPGTDPAPLARGSGRTLELLCVATLNPIKGHDMLLEALATIPHRNWHLTCAGSVTRDPATADRLRAAVTELSLDDRVTLAGDLDRSALSACYDRADVFVLATRQETYGMAVAEALAHGLPVVSTMTGAIPELVGGEAGLLVPIGDAAALAAALARVIEDEPLRMRLAEGARRVRDRLPTWEQAAERMAAVLESLDAHG